MDKKNTMLLTVIAVATLLVAVVGATFAWYNVTSENTSASRTVTTTTPKVGSVALTSAGTDLYLNITGDQMADTATAKRAYYHTTTDAAAVTTAAPSSVANFAVTGSDNATTYSCTFDLAITTTGAPANLTEGDAKVTLSLGTATGATPTFGNTLPLTAIDLTDTTATGGYTVSGITYTVTGNSSIDIKALAEFNTANRQQNNIAETNMQTSVAFSNLACTTGA